MVQASDFYPDIRCAIYVFENDEPTPARVFQECARLYLLTGRPLEQLCDHNGQVAWNLGRHHTATTWNVVKLLFAYSGTTPPVKPT